MRKKILGSFLVLSLFVVAAPSHAAGLTATQISAVISLLNAFGADSGTIANVQSTLTGQSEGGGWQPGQGGMPPRPWDGVASSTHPESWQNVASSSHPWMREASTTSDVRPPILPRPVAGTCTMFSRNLGIGSQGADVLNLQKILAADPTAGFSASSTGFFGKLTAEALKRFQAANGIASSSGIVGPLTRGFFEQRCGNDLGHGQQEQGNPPPQGAPGTHVQNTNVFGAISANTGTSIVVQYVTATTTIPVTVNVLASTTIEVFASTSTPPTIGTIANLSVGKNVMVEGLLNTDKSVTAFRVRVGILPPLPQLYNNSNH